MVTSAKTRVVIAKNGKRNKGLCPFSLQRRLDLPWENVKSNLGMKKLRQSRKINRRLDRFCQTANEERFIGKGSVFAAKGLCLMGVKLSLAIKSYESPQGVVLPRKLAYKVYSMTSEDWNQLNRLVEELKQFMDSLQTKQVSARGNYHEAKVKIKQKYYEEIEQLKRARRTGSN